MLGCDLIQAVQQFRNIKTLEILYDFMDFPEVIEREPIKLPVTLEHLCLKAVEIFNMNFLSELTALKSIYLNIVNLSNGTLVCIATNCLALDTVLLTGKYFSICAFLEYCTKAIKILTYLIQQANVVKSPMKES